MGGRTIWNFRRGWLITTALVAALTAVPSARAFDWGGSTPPTSPTQPAPLPPSDTPPTPPVDIPTTPPVDTPPTPPTEPPPLPPIDTPPTEPEVPPGTGNPPPTEEPPPIDVPTTEVPPTQESPEPATLGLALLGAAAVYVRRKK